MLTLLLAASLAHADTPPDTSASAASTPSETASTAPSGTASTPAPAPATPSATAPGSDASPGTASGTPTDATAPNPADTLTATPTATATETTPAASAAPSEPDPRAVRRFRKGKSLATAGAVMLPAGFAALGLGLGPSSGYGGSAAAEIALVFGGGAALLGAAPTFLTGVYVERSGVRLAGCTPRDQGWRHAPLVLAGVGAVATQFGNELGTDAVAPTLLAAGVGTGVVQHVLLQKDARDCGLRD